MSLCRRMPWLLLGDPHLVYCLRLEVNLIPLLEPPARSFILPKSGCLDVAQSSVFSIRTNAIPSGKPVRRHWP